MQGIASFLSQLAAGDVLLGVDLGPQQTGFARFAIADDIFPIQVGTLKCSWKEPQFAQQTTQFLSEERVDALVIGLPYLKDGWSGPQADNIHQKGLELARHFAKPVYFQNEYLTTQEAKERLNIRGKSKRLDIDSMSAVLILEGFLQDHQFAIAEHIKNEK